MGPTERFSPFLLESNQSFYQAPIIITSSILEAQHRRWWGSVEIHPIGPAHGSTTEILPKVCEGLFQKCQETQGNIVRPFSKYSSEDTGFKRSGYAKLYYLFTEATSAFPESQETLMHPSS